MAKPTAAAAYAAAYAANANADNADKKYILKQCADIVRADYPNVDEILKGVEDDTGKTDMGFK